MPEAFCDCKQCREYRKHADAIRKLKAELPQPEWDWADLQRQDEERRKREER